jgi:hypothetical protein
MAAAAAPSSRCVDRKPPVALTVEEIGLVEVNPGSGHRLVDRNLSGPYVAFMRDRLDGMDIGL